jgi:hypothetical protein
MVCGLMRRNASITTFPFTLWIGSTTTATARWFKASKLWNHERNTHQGVNSYSWIRHESIKNIATVSNIQWVSLSEEDWAFKTSLKDHTLSMIPVYQISSIIFSWTLVYLLSIYVHAW